MSEDLQVVRRHRGARGAVAALAVLGLSAGLVACGGGSSGDRSLQVESVDPSLTPVQAFAQAADASAAVSSGRFAMTMTVSGSAGGTPIHSTIDGSGAFSDGGRLSEMSMDMGSYLADIASAAGTSASAVPDRFTFDVVVDGTTMYMRIDTVPAEPLLSGWFRLDMAGQAESLGMDPSSMMSGGMSGGSFTSFVESMRGAGTDVTAVGSETLDGVEVTRYEGTIDPQTAIDRADPERRSELRRMFRQAGMGQPMPFVAWIDGDGILRRMEQTYTMDTGTGLSLTLTNTIEVTELGQPVSIEVPPADEVRDYSALQRLAQPNA